MCTTVPLRLTASSTRRVSGTPGATGFSQNTGTPLAQARISSSAWVAVGVATTTASLSNASPTRAPSLAATSAARPPSASLTTSSSTPGCAARVAAWNAPILPSPSSPTRIVPPEKKAVDLQF